MSECSSPRTPTHSYDYKGRVLRKVDRERTRSASGDKKKCSKESDKKKCTKDKERRHKKDDDSDKEDKECDKERSNQEEDCDKERSKDCDKKKDKKKRDDCCERIRTALFTLAGLNNRFSTVYTPFQTSLQAYLELLAVPITGPTDPNNVLLAAISANLTTYTNALVNFLATIPCARCVSQVAIGTLQTQFAAFFAGFPALVAAIRTGSATAIAAQVAILTAQAQTIAGLLAAMAPCIYDAASIQAALVQLINSIQPLVQAQQTFITSPTPANAALLLAAQLALANALTNFENQLLAGFAACIASQFCKEKSCSSGRCGSDSKGKSSSSSCGKSSGNDNYNNGGASCCSNSNNGSNYSYSCNGGKSCNDNNRSSSCGNNNNNCGQGGAACYGAPYGSSGIPYYYYDYIYQYNQGNCNNNCDNNNKCNKGGC